MTTLIVLVFVCSIISAKKKKREKESERARDTETNQARSQHTALSIYQRTAHLRAKEAATEMTKPR